jgi:hypothetical protein
MALIAPEVASTRWLQSGACGNGFGSRIGNHSSTKVAAHASAAASHSANPSAWSQASMPPSTRMSVPVTYAASSDARNATADAMSDGFPRAPNGMEARNWLSKLGSFS